ncbi:hypothetical protein HK104_003732 [Borealophlyctis nickersoniae]|nr:hypothetical protein HK104_003732 [Borealophlyctis nickersoniae]
MAPSREALPGGTTGSVQQPGPPPVPDLARKPTRSVLLSSNSLDALAQSKPKEVTVEPDLHSKPKEVTVEPDLQSLVALAVRYNEVNAASSEALDSALAAGSAFQEGRREPISKEVNLARGAPDLLDTLTSSKTVGDKSVADTSEAKASIVDVQAPKEAVGRKDEMTGVEAATKPAERPVAAATSNSADSSPPALPPKPTPILAAATSNSADSSPPALPPKPAPILAARNLSAAKIGAALKAKARAAAPKPERSSSKPELTSTETETEHHIQEAPHTTPTRVGSANHRRQPSQSQSPTSTGPKQPTESPTPTTPILRRVPTLSPSTPPPDQRLPAAIPDPAAGPISVRRAAQFFEKSAEAVAASASAALKRKPTKMTGRSGSYVDSYPLSSPQQHHMREEGYDSFSPIAAEWAGGVLNDRKDSTAQREIMETTPAASIIDPSFIGSPMEDHLASASVEHESMGKGNAHARRSFLEGQDRRSIVSMERSDVDITRADNASGMVDESSSKDKQAMSDAFARKPSMSKTDARVDHKEEHADESNVVVPEPQDDSFNGGAVDQTDGQEGKPDSGVEAAEPEEHLPNEGAVDKGHENELLHVPAREGGDLNSDEEAAEVGGSHEEVPNNESVQQAGVERTSDNGGVEAVPAPGSDGGQADKPAEPALEQKEVQQSSNTDAAASGRPIPDGLPEQILSAPSNSKPTDIPPSEPEPPHNNDGAHTSPAPKPARHSGVLAEMGPTMISLPRPPSVPPKPTPPPVDLAALGATAPPLPDADIPHLLAIPLNGMFETCYLPLNPTRPFRLGRSNTQGVGAFKSFPSQVVSRNHAEMFERDNKVYIRDIGSNSGTFLNSNRLSEPGQQSQEFEISSGDVVQLGKDYVVEGAIEGVPVETRHRCVKMQLMIVPRKPRRDPPVVTEIQTMDMSHRKSVEAPAPAMKEPNQAAAPPLTRQTSGTTAPSASSRLSQIRSKYLVGVTSSGSRVKKLQVATERGLEVLEIGLKSWESKSTLVGRLQPQQLAQLPQITITGDFKEQKYILIMKYPNSREQKFIGESYGRIQKVAGGSGPGTPGKRLSSDIRWGYEVEMEEGEFSQLVLAAVMHRIRYFYCQHFYFGN